MNYLTRFYLFILSVLAISACQNHAADIESGTWRATLKTDSGIEIPFNFILSDSAGIKYMDIINGEERFRVNDIRLNGDSVIIRMPLFDSEILTVYKGGSLKGRWIKHLTSKDVEMEFTAQPNTPWRFFKAVEQEERNVAGKWSVMFTSQGTEGTDTTMAVGEFKQEGEKLTGTFLTSTGDYRFLEGTVSGGKLFLSCFDGSNAYLFTGKIEQEKIIAGKFYSGLSYSAGWSAKKDANAMLPDAFSLTYLNPGYSTIDFSFPNLEGKMVSLKDDKYKNKVVIIQMMGSWCPNCMDETAYLVPFYKQYNPKGVEIIALAYERFREIERARKNVLQLKDRFEIPYELLLTGHLNDKKEVAESMPALNNFLAFPTTIIIDKKGVVRKVHTGFSGPGTGEHYTAFTTEFEQLINDLIAEKF